MEHLKDIPVFVEAVEAGGFSAASKKLNLTRSAVAKTIARLESRLGVRLFHRTTRSQNLTEEGRFFYERCQRAVEEIRLGQAELESGRREVRGKLRVTMPVIFGRRCVAPTLIKLLEKHPGLELDLSFSDRVVDLRTDGFDLAVRSGRLKDDAETMVRTIAFQRLMVCASPAYLQNRGEPQSLDDLPKYEGIIYGKPESHETWVFPTPDDPWRVVLPRSRLRLDDLDAILNAGLEGHGLIWLPFWMVRDHVASGRLRQVLKSVPSVSFETHAVWPRSPVMLPRVRLAIDTMVRELPRFME
ncbi:LysR family transcriptional regulator [Phyllobacterium salinisoli]|uniref:LysR family transcriptional regulator n=1 Tax=Phyllobacterium salinisoli TaxID=1899321 RepID=A0A368JZK3_9HYPH|nr:LysR family transcriptional regulator [Phyllobacterium salinisoli]RCS21602.1 LysR family transcriptional regulator [Phyllobacterium salinisoli]